MPIGVDWMPPEGLNMINREEARKISYEQGSGDDLVVDEIYDSRGTCGECKMYRTPECPLDDHIMNDYTIDFYCGDFIRKEVT